MRTDFWVLLKFYLRDTLRGLLDRPFFRRKHNRILFLGIIAAAYIGFFVYEIRMMHEGGSFTSSLMGVVLDNAKRLSFIEWNSYIPAVTSVVFVLVRSTFAVTPTAIYCSAALPFSKKTVTKVQQWYKRIIALCIFEVFFVAHYFFLSFMPYSVWEALALFISAHIIFFAILSVWENLYGVTSILITKNVGKVFRVYDVGVLMLSVVYFFVWRIPFDNAIYFSHLSTSVIPFLTIGVSCAVYVVFSAVRALLSPIEVPYLRQSVVNIPAFFVTTMSLGKVVVLGNIRSRLFVTLLAIDVVVGVALIATVGFSSSMTFIPYMLGAMGISGVRYADTTLRFRHLFFSLSWQPWKEAATLLVFYAVVLSPILVVSAYFTKDYKPYFLALGIYVASCIIGFLFPASEGNANDTVAFLLLVVVAVVLVLSFQFYVAFPVLMCVLCAVLFFIINHETQLRRVS